MGHRLLVVEDDRMLAELVRRGMMEGGHAVDVVSTASEGRLQALVNDYDALILDVQLPDGSGLEIVRELRRAGRSVPVLMLTAQRSPDEVVLGLDAGADDYLTKPFDLDVLKARVRALLRRGGARRMDQLVLGGLVFDRVKRAAYAGGRKLALTPKEARLLEYLLLHAGEVVTRTELLEKVWEYGFDPGSNVVDAHVARLRGKLRRAGVEPQLATIRGTGFTLTLDADAGDVAV